jgi:hypothetical protein
MVSLADSWRCIMGMGMILCLPLMIIIILLSTVIRAVSGLDVFCVVLLNGRSFLQSIL